MKKTLAAVLTMGLLVAFTGCGKQEGTTGAAPQKSEGVMTYAEYAAAEIDSEVVVETYVQAKQSWWEDKATVYTQDQDGAYFLYEMAHKAKSHLAPLMLATNESPSWTDVHQMIQSSNLPLRTADSIPSQVFLSPFDYP